MTSSVPQSATLPPPLHSPHSPFSKNRTSAFPSCFDDCDEKCNRRSQQQQQLPAQVHLCIRSEVDRTDAETSSFARQSVHSSQPTTPSTETHCSTFVREVKSNTSTPTLDTPPLLGKSKDARLACRQTIEEAYAPATTEASGDSGRPQKKELKLEECTVNRAVFSPSSVLSTTTASMGTACTGGRDSSIFSFVSRVPEAFGTGLPMGSNSSSNYGCARGCGRRTVSGFMAPPQLNPNAGSALGINILAPPCDNIAAVADFSSERSAGSANANEMSASTSRISKCKQRLQGLNRPAFDLKAVEEAQPSFLEEEKAFSAAQCFPLSEITPLLWVGSWKDAADPALLRHLGISYVLNVARELDPASEANVIARNKDIIYESIPMSDCHSQDVGAHLRQAFKFIERARAAKSRVLVHCRRGISRSPAIVVGYLMASEHWTYQEALRFVTERRSCVSLNLAFQERLSEYVPNSEFYHGPSASPAALALSAASTETPGGTLPSLGSMPIRGDQSFGNTGGGGNSCRPGPLRQQQQQSQSHSGAQTRKRDLTLPRSGGAFSASSSNAGSSSASSRASSTMRSNLSLTARPALTPSFSRAPRHPRLAIQKRKKANSNPAFMTTPTTNSTSNTTCTNTVTATPSADTNVLAAAAASEKQDKATWLEEEVASPFVAPYSIHPFGGSHRPESLSSERKAPLGLLTKPTLRQPGDRGSAFADFCTRRHCSNSDNNEYDSSRSSVGSLVADPAQDEEEVEEPGLPFGGVNRRPFAHFSFLQPSSSSNNASPALMKSTHSFSKEVTDSSTTLSHSKSNNAVSGSGGMEFSRGRRKPSRGDDDSKEEMEALQIKNDNDGFPEMRFPQPPRHDAPQASAFDNLADDECGEEEGGDDAEEPSPTADVDNTQKSNLTLFPDRLSLLTKRAGSAGQEGSSMNSNTSNTRFTTLLRQRVSMAAVKEQSSAHNESPSLGENSSSSISHGDTTGTAGGFSMTPYGTQGSLNDEPNMSGARILPHTSSLSG